MNIRVKDKVKVISGKFKGKTGVVLGAFPKEKKIVVEGVNVVKKHIKPAGGKEGGIVEINKPLFASTVMFVCPKCGKAVRVGCKREEGKSVRVCKKCGQEV